MANDQADLRRHCICREQWLCVMIFVIKLVGFFLNGYCTQFIDNRFQQFMRVQRFQIQLAQPIAFIYRNEHYIILTITGDDDRLPVGFSLIRGKLLLKLISCYSFHVRFRIIDNVNSRLYIVIIVSHFRALSIVTY